VPHILKALEGAQMQPLIREEVGLYWLYSKFDEHAGLIPFPDEACKVLRRLINEKRVHAFTFSPATSARRLVEHWLDTSSLPMQHKGKPIKEQLSGVPVGDELSDYVDLSDNLDGQTTVRCSDLVRLMRAEGMTVPGFLLADEFVELLTQDDAAYAAQYEHAWALWDERDTWANMKHQNDPDKFEKIQANLARIDAELAPLSLPFNATEDQPQQVAIRGVTKQQVLAAFGGAVIDEKSLERALENGPKWIVPARISKGTRGRGGHETQWHPVLLALALQERRKATLAKLDRSFSQYGSMSPWRDEWREQSEDLRL
jgi:hypothetical protein